MKLSIITINLNNRQGLEATIKSVRNQSFNDYEFIIIDDGSIQIIKQNEDLINYWVSETDTGIYNAMNKGIDQSNGDYCLFLNSGDYFQDDNLKKIINQIKVDSIIASATMISTLGDLTSPPESELDLLFFLSRTSLMHPVTFIKREAFISFGKFDEQFLISGDRDFFMRMAIFHKVKYQKLSGVLTVFDVTGISSNSKHNKIVSSEYEITLLKFFPEYLLGDIIKIKEFLTFTNRKRFQMLRRIDKHPKTAQITTLWLMIPYTLVRILSKKSIEIKKLNN